MRAVIVLLLGACLLTLVACKPERRGPTPEEIAQQKVSQALAAGGDAPAAPAPKVQVAAGGSRFDPPVRVDQLPTGVWYCDMGTVHYASTEAGEGRCPVCGMALTHR